METISPSSMDELRKEMENEEIESRGLTGTLPDDQLSHIESSSPPQEDKPYVLPVPEFATVVHGDEEEIFLNLRCRKGTLLKHLTLKIGIDNDVAYKLELCSMTGELLNIRHQAFNVQCTEFFPPGVHGYLPLLVDEDAQGHPSIEKWLVDDVEEMYPDACYGLDGRIEDMKEARQQETEENVLPIQDTQQKKGEKTPKAEKSKLKEPEVQTKSSKNNANEETKKKKK